MPFHLPSFSRRDFLRTTLLGSAGLLSLRAFGDEKPDIDPDFWALFSDPHIAADPATIAKGANMAEHLQHAVAEVRALAKRPAGLILNGDCAYDRGLAEDYATFTGLMSPVPAAGIPVHLTLGNHDDREIFWAALQNTRSDAPPVASKHVSVVEAARANWFLLDSLEVTKQTPGRLGDEQRAWLATALDARAGKPALVMVHHDPILAETGKKGSLLDTAELLAVLAPRRHVKALIFGHTHAWGVSQHEGLHLINLPAVAYTFGGDNGLTGWTSCRLRNDGMNLEIRANNPERPEHGKVTELAWRTG